MGVVKSPRLPILIIDDEEDVLQSYEMTLQSIGINNIRICQDSREVMDILKTETMSIMLLDLFMPHVSGQEILEQTSEQYPHMPVIVITGSNKVETAVECMKKGAFDYMVKPVEKSRLSSGVNNALEIREMKQELRTISEQFLSGGTLKHPEYFSKIITKSGSMESIFKYIEAIAGSPMSVLITGESGVGKELIAEAIHLASKRQGQFITVNVGGIDDTVFSDTLFGHKKGAFTGADSSRKGIIEQATGGTLFLDEIGDLENGSQIKLLRLLQQKEYYRLGSDSPSVTNARVIAATNVDIETRMKQGTFRKDLFFRLITHQINIPQLRERFEDLPLLIKHFINETSESLGKKTPTAPLELEVLLSTYQFPGNIRELRSIIYDAISRHESKMLGLSYFKEYIDKRLGKEHSIIPEVYKETERIFFEGDFPTLDTVQSFFIEKAMEKAKGNQSIAARLLGISQSTLSRKFKSETVNLVE